MVILMVILMGFNSDYQHVRSHMIGFQPSCFRLPHWIIMIPSSSMEYMEFRKFFWNKGKQETIKLLDTMVQSCSISKKNILKTLFVSTSLCLKSLYTRMAKNPGSAATLMTSGSTRRRSWPLVTSQGTLSSSSTPSPHRRNQNLRCKAKRLVGNW